MAIQVRYGGVWQTITGGQVFANGSWRQLVAVQVYSGGAWRLVGNFTAPPPAPGGGSSGGGGSGALSLSLSSTTIGGLGVTGATTATSGLVTVTPSGGLAPYSYAWSIVSTDGHTYTINSPTSATTSVTGSGLPLDATSTCTIHCVVTDSLGTSATSGNVTVNLTTRSTS